MFFSVIIIAIGTRAQQVPSNSENVEAMVTFGKDASPSLGDDDNVQVLFFLLPKSYTSPFYIRVYDPNIGGAYDEIYKSKDNITRFEIYSGEGVHSNPDAVKHNPDGDFKAGDLIYEEEFGAETDYDKQWYSMGPFNPLDGEFIETFGGYVFKMVVEGVQGDGGNLYKCFMSSSESENIAIVGGNIFTYEYCVRLKSKANEIAHLYPYADSEVVSIKQFNFDLDGDGKVVLYSVSKNGEVGKVSGDNVWSVSNHNITEAERGNSIDIQIVKKGDWANDAAFYVVNQYDQAVPFFSTPLGGVPKYIYKLKIEHKNK